MLIDSVNTEKGGLTPERLKKIREIQASIKALAKKGKESGFSQDKKKAKRSLGQMIKALNEQYKDKDVQGSVDFKDVPPEIMKNYPDRKYQYKGRNKKKAVAKVVPRVNKPAVKQKVAKNQAGVKGDSVDFDKMIDDLAAQTPPAPKKPGDRFSAAKKSLGTLLETDSVEPATPQKPDISTVKMEGIFAGGRTSKGKFVSEGVARGLVDKELPYSALRGSKEKRHAWVAKARMLLEDPKIRPAIKAVIRKHIVETKARYDRNIEKFGPQE